MKLSYKKRVKKNFLYNIFPFFFLFFTNLEAQLPSKFEVEIYTSILKNGKTLKSKVKQTTCFIEKNKSIESLKRKDTLHWLQNGQQPFDLFQQLTIDFDISSTQQIFIKVNPSFKIQKFGIKKNYIYDNDFSNSLCFNLKNEETQRIDYQLDSFKIIQNISLYVPVCIKQNTTKKVAGIVTVYYRGAREHLNKNTPSTSSAGRATDWGHAYIGVKDLKTNQIYFLDGWPDGKMEEGAQHFVWNEDVDKTRCEDHHSISFNINAKQLVAVKKEIKSYKEACVDYKIIDFNCTDATTKVLDKMGFYTTKDQSGTILPASFGSNLMSKLNEKKVCFENDGFRIR